MSEHGFPNCNCLACTYVAKMWTRIGAEYDRARDAECARIFRTNVQGTWTVGETTIFDQGVAVDPMSVPLPPAPPPTWKEREDRVRWVRANLTEGEQALLHKLSVDADHRARCDCDAIIAKEKKACAG